MGTISKFGTIIRNTFEVLLDISDKLQGARLQASWTIEQDEEDVYKKDVEASEENNLN